MLRVGGLSWGTDNWRRKRGGRGACAPPLFRVGGGGKDMFVPPHFQTQNLGLDIEPTDICDVTLARLASRCWARQMCPPTFCHVPTPLQMTDQGVAQLCTAGGLSQTLPKSPLRLSFRDIWYVSKGCCDRYVFKFGIYFRCSFNVRRVSNGITHPAASHKLDLIGADLGILRGGGAVRAGIL